MGTREKVYEILKKLSGLESIYDDDVLQSELGFDSYVMVSLLIELEGVLNIEFSESDMNPFALEKVKDVVNLAEKYCGKVRE